MPYTFANGLTIYTADDIGARRAQHAFEQTTPVSMIVHHMASPNETPLASANDEQLRCFDLARATQRLHMANDGVHGWADTGNHWFVFRSGIVIEGRHQSLQRLLNGKSIRGAHAGDYDENVNWGTEHEGTYDDAEMPSAQWAASVKLHAVLAQYCNIDSSQIFGHRDVVATDCPGGWLYAQLDRFRHDVHQAKVDLRNLHR